MAAALHRFRLGLLALALWAPAIGPMSPDDGKAAAAAERRSIVAGVPRGFPPHYVVGPDGEAGGFAVELMDEVARRAGIDVTYRVFDNWADAIAALAEGRIDVIPNLGATRSRRERFQYSTLYETSRVSVFVRADDRRTTRYETLKDVAVGTVAINVAERLLPHLAGVRPRSYPVLEDAFDALMKGEIQALAYPESAVLYMATMRGETAAIRETGLTLKHVSRGLAVGLDRQDLLAVLDPHLRDFTGSREFEKLYGRWFNPEKGPPFVNWYWAYGALAIVAILACMAWWKRRSMVGPYLDADHARLDRQLWKRALVTAVVIGAFMVLAAVVTVFHLFFVAFEETRDSLLDRARAETHLIDTIARFDFEDFQNAERAREATVSQLKDGFGNFDGSVELLLAERNEGQVRFLLRQKASKQFAPLELEPGTEPSEPMRRALAGETGTVVARDYRGRQVLAAYRPLPNLKLGYVIKKDLAEIAAPFVGAGLAVTVGAIAAAILAIIGYLKLTGPMIRRALGSDWQFRSLYRSIGSGVLILEPIGNGSDFLVKTINPAGLKIEKRPREGLLGQPVSGYFLNEAETGLLAAMREVWEDGTSKFLPPRRYVTPQTTTWRAFQVYRLPNGGLVAVYDDFTERQNAIIALRESEEKFRQIAENIREVFWITDPRENRLLYVNPAYEEIWGHPRQDLYDRPTSFIESIHPEDREHAVRGIAGGELCPPRDEFRVCRPDGTIRWLRGRTFPVRSDKGTIYRIAGLTEDITETKNRQARLRETQKLEAIGQMTGGIAHDFNNLLLVIQGNLALLVDEIGDHPGAAEFVSNMSMASERAAELTDRMLTFAREKPLELSRFDLNDCIRRLLPLLETTLGKTISVDLHLHEMPLLVETDEAQFETSLLNLAVNARDAMQGSGTLTVETRKRAIADSSIRFDSGISAGDYVEIAVSDTGTGIPPEVLERVFEPFYTTKEPGKGTGLGLAAVYGFIKEAGGRTSIDSVPGEGTTVQLWLPLQVAETEAASAPDADVAFFESGVAT